MSTGAHLPVACPDCARRFATTASLENHRRAQHNALAKQRAAVAGAVLASAGRYLALAESRGRDGPLSRQLAAFAERHGLVCTWCSQRVLLDVSSHHPLAPSREHVVPRSLGGARSAAENKLLAHRICNHLRGTIEAGAFRRLMAGEAQTAAQLWPDVFGEEIAA